MKIDKKKKKVLIIIAIVVAIVIILVLLTKKRKKVDLPIYDEDNPMPPADSLGPPAEKSAGSGVSYEECQGWWSCFPMKKGVKDSPESDWVKSLQKYLGITQDGHFGNGTESAVRKAINKTEVNWADYAAIKSEFCKKNPKDKACG